MIPKVPLDFMVLAYPRSGTTWAANWLTTDRSLCLHDPWSIGMPATWPHDGRTRGIACTGSYLMPKWLAQYDVPTLVIERERDDCDASMAKIGLTAGDVPQSMIDDVPAYRIAFRRPVQRSGGARSVGVPAAARAVRFDPLPAAADDAGPAAHAEMEA
jgi:hypothetical protein